MSSPQEEQPPDSTPKKEGGRDWAASFKCFCEHAVIAGCLCAVFHFLMPAIVARHQAGGTQLPVITQWLYNCWRLFLDHAVIFAVVAGSVDLCLLIFLSNRAKSFSVFRLLARWFLTALLAAVIGCLLLSL